MRKLKITDRFSGRKFGAYSAKLNINLALGVFSCVGLKERFGILCKQKSIWYFFHLKMLPELVNQITVALSVHHALN